MADETVFLPAPRAADASSAIALPASLYRRLTQAQITILIHFHVDHLFHVETAVRNGMAIADAHAHSIHMFTEKLDHHQSVRPAPDHHVHKLSQMQARAITRFQRSYLHNIEERMASGHSFEEAHVFAVHKANDKALHESHESESVEA